ncbi:MAG: hypothetical protein AAF497_24815, partial [Planctomycetota bacterium]
LRPSPRTTGDSNFHLELANSLARSPTLNRSFPDPLSTIHLLGNLSTASALRSFSELLLSLEGRNLR